MAQEIDRTRDVSTTMPDGRVSGVVRSNRKNRRKTPRELKAKMEEEQEKARRRRRADILEIENDEHENTPDDEDLAPEESTEQPTGDSAESSPDESDAEDDDRADRVTGIDVRV